MDIEIKARGDKIMKRESRRIYVVVIIVLVVMLISSLGLNIKLLMRDYNQINEINSSVDNSSLDNEMYFNTGLIGTWRDGRYEIIISEDGSYVWISYSSGDDPYIYDCNKGYISNNVMITTERYSSSKNEDGFISSKDILYYSYIDIPDNEWESGIKSGGYQIIFHGASFGLKTDSTMTNYNFIKQ